MCIYVQYFIIYNIDIDIPTNIFVCVDIYGFDCTDSCLHTQLFIFYIYIYCNNIYIYITYYFGKSICDIKVSNCQYNQKIKFK